MYLVTIREFISEMPRIECERISCGNIEHLQAIETGVIHKKYEVDLMCVPVKGGSFEVHASREDIPNYDNIRFLALCHSSELAIEVMVYAKDSVEAEKCFIGSRMYRQERSKVKDDHLDKALILFDCYHDIQPE